MKPCLVLIVAITVMELCLGGFGAAAQPTGGPIKTTAPTASPCTHLGTIKASRHIHNMAWGDADGKTLYLCARSGLYRMRLGIPGTRLVHEHSAMESRP
jgi:hypothetical protein